jgi:CRISP-associated protein Cas1
VIKEPIAFGKLGRSIVFAWTKVTDFDWVSEEGGIYLTKRARRVFLKQFEDRMCLLMSHPDVGEQISYRRAIQLQVRRYVRAVVEQGEYVPYRRPW